MSLKNHAVHTTILLCLGMLYAGCDTGGTTGTSCANKTLAAGNDLTCSIRSGTANRSYLLYASKNYDPAKPTALIIDAHGFSETAQEQAGTDTEFCSTLQVAGSGLIPGGEETCWPGKGSGFRLEADMPGNDFIVVNPQGQNNAWSTGDEDFILAVVAEVKKIASIDPEKVYISGISNGSMLTNWVGCPNAGSVFAGMAPVSGGANCTSVNNSPIPTIWFDAPADFLYDTAKTAKDALVTLYGCKKTGTWLTVDSTTTDKLCRDDPFSTNPRLVPCSEVVGGIEPTVCTRSYDCKGGAEVVWCEVSASNEHGPDQAAADAHLLYGNDSHLNLPSLAWKFFKRFQ